MKLPNLYENSFAQISSKTQQVINMWVVKLLNGWPKNEESFFSLLLELFNSWNKSLKN